MRTVDESTRLRRWVSANSELGMCLVLAGLGCLVLIDAAAMPADFTHRGPLGPTTVPYLVGSALLVIAALLARDVLRGGRGEAEGGEDVDLSVASNWRSVLLLAAAFLANAALINIVGFPLSGMILFWGSLYALGRRNATRDPLIAAVLSVLTYFAFNNLLGVPLPGGPLMGVL